MLLKCNQKEKVDIYQKMWVAEKHGIEIVFIVFILHSSRPLISHASVIY